MVSLHFQYFSQKKKVLLKNFCNAGSPGLPKQATVFFIKILIGSLFLLLYKLNNIVYRILLNKSMEISAVMSGGRLAIFNTPTHNLFKDWKD